MVTKFPAEIIQRLEETQVVAGFAVEEAEHATPLAEALLAGGITAIELTLRTPVAVEALRSICDHVPDMLVGAGTVLTPEQVKQVRDAGADFAVAPGLNPRIVHAAQDAGLPFAPGIATPSDLEAAVELGCLFVKFFPAEAMGGVRYLRSMSAPYKHLGIRYFPLGGIDSENMIGYFGEDNVLALGGTWIVKRELVLNEDWAGIESRAAEVRRVLGQAR